ncbi:nose resistant to fluoxetine protein 6 [Trichonephila clavata]|uniref:Nose resistant to fluoxetine protein 6 n=1 Tax=Trichonephila clavata TaxID=2740835 RepID=A0A8X6J8T6_TRICU|nr:nose resistant to fluoxetine protein 6 [Trichonephila clavata]
MIHFLGLCFPSICTTEDLTQLVKLIPFPGKASLDRCEVKSEETDVDHTQLIIICIFLILIFLVVISTFIHWLLHSKKDEKSAHKDKRCVNISLAFSMCNNTSRLMKNIEDDTEGLLAGQCVRGIVVASVAWIILGYTYLFPYEAYYFQMSSLANLRDYWDQGYFSAVMSFPFAIDALFVCYGFLLTYSLWQPALKPQDIEINVISLIVKNYIRLCLPLLLFFGIVLLLPLIASGPFWGDLLEGPIPKCRDNAAAYFGMYSNFLDVEEQCFPHLWFVSCLAQLTLVGIFLSLILSRNIKFGVFVTLLICIACNATVGVLTFKHDLPPSFVAYFTEESSSLFWKINMALPLSHFGSYAAGMLAGIWIARKEYHRTRMWLGAIGWIACLGILYALQVVLFNSRDGFFRCLFVSNIRSNSQDSIRSVRLLGYSRMFFWSRRFCKCHIFLESFRSPFQIELLRIRISFSGHRFHYKYRKRASILFSPGTDFASFIIYDGDVLHRLLPVPVTRDATRFSENRFVSPKSISYRGDSFK